MRLVGGGRKRGNKRAAKTKLSSSGASSHITTFHFKAGVIAYLGAGSMPPSPRHRSLGRRLVACAAHMRLYVAAIQPGKFGDEIEPDWIRLSASPPGRAVVACNPKNPPRTHYAQLLAIQKTGQHRGTIGTHSVMIARCRHQLQAPQISTAKPIDDQASWYGWSDRTLSLHWLVE